MKNLIISVMALGLMLDGCGGGLDVTMKPSAGFKRTSSVAVESDNLDNANLKSRIEKALFRNGIDVASPSFARASVQAEGNSTNRLSNSSSRIMLDSASSQSSAGYAQGNKSVYLLKFTYEFDYTFSGEVITDFSAAIVEPGTGEVVGIVSYHGKGDGIAPDELADMVGKQISQKLK